MRKILSYLVVIFVGSVVAGCGGGRGIDQEIDITSAGGFAGDDATTSLYDDDFVDGDLLSKRVIYFAYDSSNLSTQSDAVIRAHAAYLQNSPDVRIVLEGHADERGTREYNLALGEARARAVANLMQALSITPNRVQTVSYGEERPVALGHDESAYSVNRRVEILYQ